MPITSHMFIVEEPDVTTDVEGSPEPADSLSGSESVVVGGRLSEPGPGVVSAVLVTTGSVITVVDTGGGVTDGIPGVPIDVDGGVVGAGDCWGVEASSITTGVTDTDTLTVLFSRLGSSVSDLAVGLLVIMPLC